MTTISTQWPIGQFNTTLTAEVDDATLSILGCLGLRFLGQRVTEVDKILGAFETVDGKSKRKANWKRNEVEYSDALRDELAKAFETIEFPDSTKEAPHKLEGILVDMTKYEGGGKEPAYAAEKRAVKEYLAANGGKLKNGEARTVASFAANRGVEAPTDETKWEEDVEFLLRVKGYLKSLNEQE